MNNKTVLITGASGGIGSEISRQFAKLGANIIIHFNSNINKAEALLNELEGKNHLLVRGDLSVPNNIENVVSAIMKKYGRIDVLINNAGVYTEHSLTDVDFLTWQKNWEKIINTNLMAPANLTYLVANEMVRSGGGKIINISSRGAFRGEPTAPAYGASKAGLNAMGQSLSIALAPHKVYIYTIAPGFVETAMARPHLTGKKKQEIMNQSPIGRVAKPKEIANTAVFLAGENTAFLTGCIIDVNGASYLRS